MKLLDLFCCAGGAAMGYHQAGFDVVGVDHVEQPHYPFEFYQADALEFAQKHGREFDVIHASPPCQAFSAASLLHDNEHPMLIEPTREILQELGKPYIIENVVGAPLQNPLMLCGTMFGLLVVRHRLFETSPVIWFPPAPCCHQRKTVPLGRAPDEDLHYASVVGHFSNVEFGKKAMGIDWMTQTELAQAIPPAYTKYIGERMLEAISRLPDNASGVSAGFGDEAVSSAQAGSFSLNPTQPHKQGD